ncbi:filamentous hemagglutinin N-terminal domain-containing protein [Paraburkholderia phymatum]|uniref:Filamentous haemagglutinin family outer membrane protein n=1 Tax=Paraburkholderia phymatum (strain DSM 17167 / CIP 108236 / LMG 21445 / STM815) TaxID=391038 RepID=B2JVE9_PARP8|nr:filamentous hemagglutinin N-terminal domain-containing protein [Paraburkholderia phymatum]ACC74926.1 filamentous haemagglutinin family outer membrane protein [Paraburkholderia phymatum STM815]
MRRAVRASSIRCVSRCEPSTGHLWIAFGVSIAELAFAHAAWAAGVLPQGGRYVAGAGSIANGGNALVVTQPGSTRGIIEWNSFSVGGNNSVSFDNGTGATLNRVTGGTPSAILGRLSATGSLYVINPQGILVGPSGVVTTGGRFVASTLDVCNCAFMKGGDALTLSGDSNASVVNLGRIRSGGGDVFLIARRAVVNAGDIEAPKGSAELASGSKVLLQDSTGSRQVFVQTGSQGTVADRGVIQAAQISLQAADGNVYALAGGGTRVRATGTGTRDGHVWLLADGGHVAQSGVIVATSADGSGGTVDTQASQLTFGRNAAVHAAQWNLSTPSFTIDAAAARALRHSLNAGTSVNVSTTGADGAMGDLNVATNLLWQGAASLRLAAYRNVSIAQGASIANRGAGDLSLRADAASLDNAGSVANHGVIDWSRSTGTVSAFYDMNGTYLAGTQRGNAAWTPGAYSGLLSQSTGYKLVNSLSDLERMASDLAGSYALGKNIDASATSNGSYMPIGNANTPFTGQLDGQGKTIGSLTLAPWVPASPYAPKMVGLFGAIGSQGVVRNLNVTGRGALGENQYAYMGMLAGQNAGTVLRVNVAGTLTSGSFSAIDYTIAGGLAGGNTGAILRSSSSVSLATGNTLGGLVGANGGLIDQSFASGSVVSSSYINQGGGGLAGDNTGTISRSYATGPVSLYGYCRGAAGTPCGGAGLVVTNEGTVNQSFATGLVTQPFYEPIGIARTNTGSISNDVYWNKDTTAASIGVKYGTPIPDANGLTAAQMRNPASFVSYDFSATGVWAMPAGATHPVLRWQLAQ